tara:strand:- start:188 stop:349 length:162 start_codon:yes stop_codon:yes gene_type:complete
MTDNKQEVQPKKKTCPCGRSPIALCIGWHSLSESEYKAKLKAWNEHHNIKEEE